MKSRDKRRRVKARRGDAANARRGDAATQKRRGDNGAKSTKVEIYPLVDDLHHPAERFGQKDA